MAREVMQRRQEGGGVRSLSWDSQATASLNT